MPEKTANIGDPVVAIASYADHPSAFIACNDDTSHFTTPDIAGIVAYRRRGGHRCVTHDRGYFQSLFLEVTMSRMAWFASRTPDLTVPP